MGDALRESDELVTERLVELKQVRRVPLGHDERVPGRYRRDVEKREEVRRFRHAFGRNPPTHDLAE